MEKSGSVDEFFGDQSSESGSDWNDEAANKDAISSPFRNAAGREYHSQESSIKTLSYLDGFDETKEEKLQDGFCNGYKQTFGDAFRIGQRLGSLSAIVAASESKTLSQDLLQSTSENSMNNMNEAAVLIRQFLTNEILIDNSDKEADGYADALANLSARLERFDLTDDLAT
ncbi:hypothetical protein HJC23_004512 [Cyclotella cryptica]|uniref:Essential protein Yae1 N-terminal domain-containing protein n=1 Tax=Cyclotella cryptica TaxID=29204 RepID=A0ABD3P230_9STRA|eukprot:CCRYP_019013-RA/>CCRYP_019013-RA protein AED:0.03 eAED:-0.03 QI:0/-1/0/1/-1/1/1/0/170